VKAEKRTVPRLAETALRSPLSRSG
jgi:hypothetical protein